MSKDRTAARYQGTIEGATDGLQAPLRRVILSSCGPVRFGVSAAKVGLRAFDVERDLAREGGEIRVLFLVAELVQKRDAHVAAVELAAIVEEMNFEHRSTLMLDRGPYSQARYPAQRPAGNTRELYREDSGQRRPVVLHLHVGGGKAELAPHSVAAHHAPADRIRAAQQPLRAHEIARPERRTHGRARYPLAVQHHAGQRGDLESETRRSLLQHDQVAPAPCAEPEIVSHEQPAREDALDKVIRRDLREGVVEAAQVDAIDAEIGQEFQLLAQRRKEGGGLVGREKFARMRLEGEHTGR